MHYLFERKMERDQKNLAEPTLQFGLTGLVSAKMGN